MSTTPRPPAKIKPNFAQRMNNDVQLGMLKRFKTEATMLTIKLMDGTEEHGFIKDFDTFSIEFRTHDARTACFYKHGIVGFMADKT